MEEVLILKENSKEIKFYSTLSVNGICVECNLNQFHCGKEREAFEKQLRTERDVVGRIYYYAE